MYVDKRSKIRKEKEREGKRGGKQEAR